MLVSTLPFYLISSFLIAYILGLLLTPSYPKQAT